MIQDYKEIKTELNPVKDLMVDKRLLYFVHINSRPNSLYSIRTHLNLVTD